MRPPTSSSSSAALSLHDSGGEHMTQTDFTHLMPAVAPILLGQPNERLSKAPHDVRFGNHGSMSVDYEKGIFYDHESSCGGGVLELIKHKTGRDRSEAMEWLRREGLVPLPSSAALAGRPSVAATASNRMLETYPYCDRDGVVLFEAFRAERFPSATARSGGRVDLES
jgi:hypothetical protein